MIVETSGLATDLLRLVGLQLLYTGIIFLACFPFIYWFRHRHPNIIAALCWLILGRLFLPVDSASPYSLRAFFDKLMFQSAETSQILSSHGSPETLPVLTANMTPAPTDILALVVLCVWIICSILVLAAGLNQRRHLRQLAKVELSPVPQPLAVLFEECKARFGVRRKVTLAISRNVDFAYTIGSIRPILVLPAKSADVLSRAEIGAVIAHETGHIARWDDARVLLQLLIRSTFFFFPVVKYCQRYLTLAREQLCDRAVLKYSDLSAASYGNSLVKMLDLQFSRATPMANHIWCSSLTAGGAMRSRLHYLCEQRYQNNTRPVAAVVLFALLALVVWPLASYNKSTAIDSAQAYISPVHGGRITSAYGERPAPFGGDTHFHKGIDIAASAGKSVLAIGKGVVLEAREYSADAMPPWGNYVVIDHGRGRQSRYTHLQEVKINSGDKVTGGQVIAGLGATGKATGPHVHFELIQNGEHLNPADYIRF